MTVKVCNEGLLQAITFVVFKKKRKKFTDQSKELWSFFESDLMAGKVSNKFILLLSVFWLAASLIGAANAQPAQSRKMKRRHQHCRLGTLARERERERESEKEAATRTQAHCNFRCGIRLFPSKAITSLVLCRLLLVFSYLLVLVVHF